MNKFDAVAVQSMVWLCMVILEWNVIRGKCLQCGGGGSGNWYDCVCDNPEPSAEALRALEDVNALRSTAYDFIETEKVIAEANRVLAKWERYNIDFEITTSVTDEISEYDFSIVMICDLQDSKYAEIISQWMFQKELVSTPDGFCIMPVDADLCFQIRAVSIRDFNDGDNKALWDLFHALPWGNRDVAQLTIRMNR
ncbi:MAG: hypothetical protein ACOVQ0_13370 [Novosphingobium sp.]|uniref:hypothetical protein n=1 Tax=Novosphingobium sp. TaxID=1874826 RepID=UPI003B9A0529